MECAVRRSVPAIRAAPSGGSADGSHEYKWGRHASARANNAKKVSHPQGCPDQHAHYAGSGVPRSVSLRAASDSSHHYRKEYPPRCLCDTYHHNSQADPNCSEDPHPDHDHSHRSGTTSEYLGSFDTNAAATRVDGSRSFDG